jgi:phosphatidylglycerol:prolipoprotein diacylglycerol transferase
MTFDQFGFQIHIGSFTIPVNYYGIILVTGAFVAAYLASLEAQRRRHNPELVWDGLIWALIGGIVGARLWHIFTPPPSMVEQGITTGYYLTHPLDAINTRMGGLGIPGAVLGGLLGLYLFTRWKKLNFLEWVDIAAPAIPLGQAIGRWGNFINQELYGAPTTLPWGLAIDPAHRVPGYTDPTLRFHPLFLYESIGNLIICGALLYIARRQSERLKAGDLFLLYLIFYPTLRFFLDFIRLDNAQLLGLNANQTVMLIIAVASGLVLYQRHRRLRRHELKAQPAPAEQPGQMEQAASPEEPVAKAQTEESAETTETPTE